MTFSQPEPGIVAAPPKNQVDPVRWARRNLFNSPFNTVLTIVTVVVLVWLAIGIVQWVFGVAQWEVVQRNLRLMLAGRYPADLSWRLWATVGVFTVAGGLTWGVLSRNIRLFNTTSLAVLVVLAALSIGVILGFSVPGGLILLGMVVLLAATAYSGYAIAQRFQGISAWLTLVWLAAYILGLVLLQGLLPGMRTVRLQDLSGFVLTLLTAVTSIVLCFPFGVLLALGRQSDLIIVRWVCIAFIEIIRGLPLITILFMAQVMLPLVLAPGSQPPDRVLRAIAGLTIFAAAYLAENVRGGLQAIPRGQSEAARALGLNGALVTLLIVLPQALKAVIPTIVGQFISLFKDTSLLAIVGLVELLGISQSILANPQFLGRYAEVYTFAALIYWVCCYAMALGSRQIEKQLSTGQR